MSQAIKAAIAVVLLSALWVTSPTHGGTFTQINTSLPSFYYSSMAWGDYDNDGDLDIAVTGHNKINESEMIGEIYRNDNGSFTAIGAGITPTSLGSLSWGDYDNDGDLDLFETGYDGGFNTATAYHANLYRNDGGDTFTLVSFPGIGVNSGYSAWVDYDGDGDLDLSYSGVQTGFDEFALYRNDGNGNFSYVSTGIPNFSGGSLEWADYDNDGDQDILISGQCNVFEFHTAVYRNDGGGNFTEISSPFFQEYDGNAVWGDYDQDGDLDIYINGNDHSGTMFFTFVYENVGADNFVDLGATLPRAGEGSTFDIGDVDGDGDFDALMTGVVESTANVFTYEGDATFAGTIDSIPNGCCGSASFADYDNDNDLDIYVAFIEHGSYFFRNDTNAKNTPPLPPSALSAEVSADTAFLSWNAASDAETAAAGLTYNVRLGTTPGGIDVVSPMADIATGYRRIVALGNADQRLAFNVSGLADGVYYWSVQSIDNNFAGSPFANEASFVIGNTEAVCGDVTADGNVSIADAVFLINYIFGGGPAPSSVAVADADLSGSISISDAVYIIAYIFGGGPAPCSPS